MSGKKSNRFRITVTFICNQDGTEKYGFRYRNNKTAWMTAKFFEEWIKELDQQFQCEDRHVGLTLDNFPSGEKNIKTSTYGVHLVPVAPL